MPYPPLPHTETDPKKLIALVHEFPFAHFFTSESSDHSVTKLPFIADQDDLQIIRLRAHINALNPQVNNLDGCHALVAFSGPDSYISPNWRLDKTRAATWDYTSVHIKGVVRVRKERSFFEQLITDLAALNEPRFRGVSSREDWSLSDSPTDYIDRLFPHLVAFEINVSDVQGISKLHQDFPDEDALSVANHLNKSRYDQSKQIGRMIKNRLPTKESKNE